VIVSYLEWVQNRSNEHWEEERVNKELKDYLTKATKDIYDLSVKNKTSLKEAAFSIAIERLTS